MCGSDGESVARARTRQTHRCCGGHLVPLASAHGTSGSPEGSQVACARTWSALTFMQSRVWHEAAANRRPIVGSTLVYAQPQCRVFCPKFKTLGGHRRADPATRMGEGGRAGARAQEAADGGAAAAGEGERGRCRAGQVCWGERGSLLAAARAHYTQIVLMRSTSTSIDL